MRQLSIALITFNRSRAHVTVVGKTPHGPVVAEDIRDLQSAGRAMGPTMLAVRLSASAKRGVKARSSGLMTS